MTRYIRLNIFLLGAVFLISPAHAATHLSPLRVVPAVDLNRYAGKWYEIARLPNWFQRGCASDVTATYTLRPDGKINVLNECRESDGSLKAAKGTARPAAAKEPNTKLKVSFFWPFSGNYWIIDLDPDYKWVAIGEPDREYFWILSRSPNLDEKTYQEILERAKDQGYNFSALLKTRHNP